MRLVVVEDENGDADSRGGQVVIWFLWSEAVVHLYLLR
jgi:hypothetical protein